MSSHHQYIHPYHELFVGVNTKVPVLDGSQRRYISLDNAASTPALKAVQKAVDEFLPYYSSVHRGNGFKSQLSTDVYEEARYATFEFLNADPAEHTCIFTKNTTESINKLARRFPFNNKRNVVLTSGMEHHSNDLPWRGAARTVHIGLTPEGTLDEDHFDQQLERFKDEVALVAITGASNVTGYLNPIHRLAEKAHAVKAHILVDCAQLAPHRKVDMRALDDPAHFDYVSISAHKMYAPFGTGALVGRHDTFMRGDPDMVGGGTVEIVTLDNVVWAEPPDRDEAGSPNTIGAIALAAAIEQLNKVGMENVAHHEAELTNYALQQLSSIPKVHLFGDQDPARAADRLGVIPMELEGISHFKVAAILGHEFGIGIRSGCFCAHPYILHLLRLSPEEARGVQSRMLSGDKSEMPGLVRASFGLYNTPEDVDELVEALRRILNKEYQGVYVQDQRTGEYIPEGWAPDFDSYFTFRH
jgi:cysteine desulfurase/selenocysteine lyase